jgi:hypothetical protein
MAKTSKKAGAPQVKLQSDLGHKPDDDKKTHINIHSKAATPLGKLLYDFAHTPFTHPYFSSFYSIEGFRWYVSSGFTEDRMRYLSGSRASRVGKTLRYVRNDNFAEDVMAANYQKIIQHEDIRQMMIESTLPFDYYYVDERSPLKLVINPKWSEEFIKGFEEIRTALKQGVVPELWLRAEKRYLAMKQK